MCGRATLSSPSDDVARLFEADPIDLGPPRFNIAPTQPMLTVRAGAARRQLAFLRWGLVPWWAKPAQTKALASKCINARAETAPRAPAFRDAFRRRRCLVVIDGFYEWKVLPDGRRAPHHIVRGRMQPFAIAGLWDAWSSGEERIESCAVITTRAAGPMRELHDRMPLVLAPGEWDEWLHATADAAARLLEGSDAVLDARARELVAVPVSTWVNDVRHDDARCIAPAEVDPDVGQLDFGFAESAGARRRR